MDNNSAGDGLRDFQLEAGDKSRHYFEIQIDATHLANLKRYGVIVKGSYYTIDSVELRASCSNKVMRTEPRIATYRRWDRLPLDDGIAIYDA